ncbi:MAG: hypothetical protein ACOX4I_00820 [Anaerovoracaceae bacterium]|jgi:hypothetical protein
MKKRIKTNIFRVLLLTAVIALVIVGGIYERGYYWPASEVLLIPLGVGWIVCARKEKKHEI